MENDTQTKELLDYNIFELIGLDLEEADQIQIESMLYKSALAELLETGLKSTLSEVDYEMFEASISDSSTTIEDFINNLKAKMSEFNLNYEELFNLYLEKAEIEFIYDQLKLLEEDSTKLENQTDRELKQSLCNTIKQFIEEKQWDQVSESFKKLSVEVHQV